MADAKRLVVVGGGITGLSAAHAAVRRARERARHVAVTVIEASPRFGGSVITDRVGGFVLDGGPDSWVANKPQASDLARDLGLGGALIGTTEANRRYYIAWRGVLHEVPEGLVLGVPTTLSALTGTRLFSLAGKVRMAMELFVPRREETGADESIAEFARRRLGREAAERLVAPLLGGISAGDATDLSVRSAFPQLVAMEREHGSLVRGMRAQKRARVEGSDGGKGASAFVTLRDGIGELVEVLAERLRADGVDLRRGVGIRALSQSSAGWTLSTLGGEHLSADAVLLAIPAHAAAPLASTHDETLGHLLSGLRSATTATVFLGYRRAEVTHPLDASGFIVPRAMQRPILAGTWVSSKWSGRAPEGHVLLRAFIGGPVAESALQLDDTELVRIARSELQALMGLSAEPMLSRVFRFEHGSAQMRVGHAAVMRDIRERLATAAPGVAIAGGGYQGIGIPDCVRQGQEAARALVDAL